MWCYERIKKGNVLYIGKTASELWQEPAWLPPSCKPFQFMWVKFFATYSRKQEMSQGRSLEEMTIKDDSFTHSQVCWLFTNGGVDSIHRHEEGWLEELGRNRFSGSNQEFSLVKWEGWTLVVTFLTEDTWERWPLPLVMEICRALATIFNIGTNEITILWSWRSGITGAFFNPIACKHLMGSLQKV